MDRNRVGKAAALGGVVVFVFGLGPALSAAAPLLGGVIAAVYYRGGIEHGEPIDFSTLSSPFDAFTREPVQRGVKEGAAVGAAAGLTGATLGLVVGALIVGLIGNPGTPLLPGGAPGTFFLAALVAVVEAGVGGVLVGVTSALFW